MAKSPSSSKRKSSSSKSGTPKKGAPKKGKKQAAPAKLPKSLRKGDLPRTLADVWAAGVGALVQAKQTGGKTFDALVDRGEAVTRKGSDATRSALEEVEAAASRYVGQARSTADGAVGEVQARVEQAVEAALTTLGVPTQDEVATLRALVTDLEARIAQLGQASTPVADVDRPAYEVAPHPEGWAVRRAGVDRALSVSSTKKEALRQGRAAARDHAPSTLTIRNLDGGVGDVLEYGG